MKPWIAFDAAGTLFEPAQAVEKIYADCFSKLGFASSQGSWKAAIAQAFSSTPEPVPGDPQSGEEAERAWWRELVDHAVLAAGIQPDRGTVDAAFEELFAHYAAGAAWKPFPETKAVLSQLRAKGIRLGVVSNFDSRIHPVIEQTGLSPYFEFVLTSADVSARKPSPRLLESFMRRAEVDREHCCLVGDSAAADGGAALAAGIDFFHLQRPGESLDDFVEWHRKRFRT